MKCSNLSPKSQKLTSHVNRTVSKRIPQPFEGPAAAVSGERAVVRPRPQVHQLRQLCADALTDYRCWMTHKTVSFHYRSPRLQ